jgi:hypothetical protein
LCLFVDLTELLTQILVRCHHTPSIKNYSKTMARQAA